MTSISAPIRIQNYYKRNIGRVLFKKPFPVHPERPIVSFTFDDFPRSALLAGGKILADRGLAGTYYTSFSLLGTDGPSGPHFTREDLTELLAQGHELGCHTFTHCHSWDTPSQAFEDSVLRNRGALAELLPGTEFKSFSYPLSEPRALSKRKISRYFQSCRAGGQTFNSGIADLARLSAYFLEKSRDNMPAVRDLIGRNRDARGWLIFATHDVAESPSPYGCTPQFFADVIDAALRSGAAILTVNAAVESIQAAGAH